MAEVAEELSRALRDDEIQGSEIYIVVRTGLPLATAVERVDAAFTAELLKADEGAWDSGGSMVAPTLEGPALVVQTYELARRLPGMVAELDRAGVTDGRIEMYDPTWPAVTEAPRPTHFLECRLAVRGQRVPPGPGNAMGYWVVDPVIRRTIVGQAARWCLDLPAERVNCFLNAVLVPSSVPVSQVREMLELTARTVFGEHDLGGGQVHLIVEAGGRFRMAVLSLFSAHVSFVDGSIRRSDFDWGRSLSAVAAPLRSSSEWAARGFVKRGRNWDATGEDTLRTTDWVPVSRTLAIRAAQPGGRWPRARDQRDLEERYMLDAFGAFVVPVTARDFVPAGWAVTRTGSNFLVEHANPESWFGQEKPDPQTLESSRRELGDLLPPAPSTR